MGFANIWATKQECNGKGQRRWCVSRPVAVPGFRRAFGQRVFSANASIRRLAGSTSPSRRATVSRRDRRTIGACVTCTRRPRVVGLDRGPEPVARGDACLAPFSRVSTFRPLQNATQTHDPDPPPPSLQQPRVREPVGYHSQVQPEHLQAVLPRVRQGHRLREGACRVEQSRPSPLQIFGRGAFFRPAIRRRFEPPRRARNTRVPRRLRRGVPRAARQFARVTSNASSRRLRHGASPPTRADLSPYVPSTEQLSRDNVDGA